MSNKVEIVTTGVVAFRRTGEARRPKEGELFLSWAETKSVVGRAFAGDLWREHEQRDILTPVPDAVLVTGLAGRELLVLVKCDPQPDVIHPRQYVRDDGEMLYGVPTVRQAFTEHDREQLEVVYDLHSPPAPEPEDEKDAKSLIAWTLDAVQMLQAGLEDNHPAQTVLSEIASALAARRAK